MGASSSRERLISSLKKSKQYLSQRVEKIPSYQELIDLLDAKLQLIGTDKQLTVKIVSPNPTLAEDFKRQKESNELWRSLYRFEVVALQQDTNALITDCGLLCSIYPVSQAIGSADLSLLQMATSHNITLLVAIATEQETATTDLQLWFDTNISQAIDQRSQISWLLPSGFMELNNPQDNQLLQEALLDKVKTLQDNLSDRQYQEVKVKLDDFFRRHQQDLWREIKQIKTNFLAGKQVHNYRQNKLKPILNQLDRLQQQEFSNLKQSIQQYRQQYLNPFLPDSWIFEQERILEASEVKIVSENSQKYAYLTINNQEKIEYLYSYILGLYQTKITAELKSKWTNLTSAEGQKGLTSIIIKLNCKLPEITLFDSIEEGKISQQPQSKIFPQLDLNQLIDFQCLKLNSRIEFEYDYTQSSWFRLGIYFSVGLGLYLVTKFYFGQGRYIGFLIVILQLVNLLTGQSAKKIKLQQHQKELKRITNQKYQTLLRLIVDRLIQTLIDALEQNRKEIKQQLDAIADLAHSKLDKIQENIEEHKTHIDTLAKDRQKIQSWFK